MLRITAKPKDGLWRCGVYHPALPVEHPRGRFSAAEEVRLRAEPRLLVVDVAEPRKAKGRRH